ncbi:MAG: hypothetical protein Q8L11_04045 [Candidatus Moranbacteria bacterium]|nr:hypothetical protein [bacterium]MDP1834069.1 hypothetical protein [Candidatus Moranbacteria bacterium]
MSATPTVAAKVSAKTLRRAKQAAENRGLLIPTAIRLAIKWAAAIEMVTDKESEIGEIAAVTCKQINAENLSGIPYEYMVFFLGQNWIFGESLKKWHTTRGSLPRPKRYDNLLLDVGVPIF